MYRFKHTIRESIPYGVDETLINEGVSSGHNWALIKIRSRNPNYECQCGETYVLRIDISEWMHAYDKLFIKNINKISKMLLFGNNPIDDLVHYIALDNSSPGWWDNGFSRQLCMSTVLFNYYSDEDRLMSVIKSGKDYDTVNYDDIIRKIFKRLTPMFDLFKANFKPGIPYLDDF